jgi:hypothetical protein
MPPSRNRTNLVPERITRQGETMPVRLNARGRASIATTSLACSVALGLAGGRAHAQGATAQQRYDDGDRWMAAGRLDEACAAFEESNRLDARAGTLIRLGECREQNHQLASAVAAYRDALARVKDPRKRVYAQQQLTALEPRLSYLTVVVPDDRRLDGLAVNCDDQPIDAALWNQPQPIDGGDHVIAAQADGHEAWRTTAHVPVEGGQIRVELPQLVEVRKPEAAPGAPAGPPAEPVVPPPSLQGPPPASAPPQGDRDAPPPSIFTTRRKIGVGVAVVGGGAAVLGAVLGSAAKGKQNDALALCPDGPACQRADAANALMRSGHHQALEANIALGVAAAAAIGAGALWFTGAPAESPKRVTVVPALAPGWAGIAVAGRL